MNKVIEIENEYKKIACKPFASESKYMQILNIAKKVQKAVKPGSQEYLRVQQIVIVCEFNLKYGGA